MTMASTPIGDGLLRVDRLLADPGVRPSSGELVAALAVDVNGAVIVLGPDGAVLARAGATAGTEAAHAAVTADDGARYGRGVRRQGWSVRVWQLADSATQVVAARLQPWTLPVEVAAARAATIIATTLLADQNDAQRERLAAARHAVWRSVFQMLMTSRAVEAQRVAGALEPRILDTAEVRVHLLAGRSRDRKRILTECEELLGGSAVFVSCPGRPGHVIVIEPVHQGRPGAGHPSPVRAGLTKLTASSASRCLGSSRTHPIAATAAAYSQAVGALATAAVRPTRTADAEERRTLTDLLGVAAAGWAADFLAPLTVADDDGTLRHTLAVALSFTRIEAAAILGVHRNTVQTRVAAAGDALGVDLCRLPQRAAVDLALRAQRGEGAGEQTLAEVLDDAKLRAWAVDLLETLDSAVTARGPARMRDLLLAFAHADGGITAAAYAVGLSPNTATRWLTAAEGAGGMRLRHGYGGAHEVAVALAVTEGLPLLPSA